MKTEIKKMLLVLIASTTLFAGIFAQKGIEDGSKYGHGQDSINCLRSFSIYKEFFKHGNFKDALPSWREMYNNCPASYISIYIDGVKMYNSLIAAEKDVEKQNKLLDTLEMVYMQRIKYFNKKGEVLGRYGLDYLTYRRTELPDQEKGYKLLEQAISIDKAKTQYFFIAPFFTASIVLYNAQKLTAEKVITNYTTASDVIDGYLKTKPTDADLLKTKESLDQQFASSGVANCDVLSSIFTPKFEQNSGDLETIKKITKLLDDNKCTETVLYEKAVEKQYELEPSASAASYVANLFIKKEKYDKAVEYLKMAVDKETDPKEKANYNYKLGLIVLDKYNQPENAKKYAVEAIKADREKGAAYILMGKAYISGRTSCGTTDFEKNAIFWVAVDKFIQAKSVDPSVTEDANNLIETYSKYFPNKESAFFLGINAGDPYKVNCWINETTTARF